MFQSTINNNNCFFLIFTNFNDSNLLYYKRVYFLEIFDVSTLYFIIMIFNIFISLPKNNVYVLFNTTSWYYNNYYQLI